MKRKIALQRGTFLKGAVFPKTSADQKKTTKSSTLRLVSGVERAKNISVQFRKDKRIFFRKGGRFGVPKVSRREVVFCSCFLLRHVFPHKHLTCVASRQCSLATLISHPSTHWCFLLGCHWAKKRLPLRAFVVSIFLVRVPSFSSLHFFVVRIVQGGDRRTAPFSQTNWGLRWRLCVCL